MRKKNSYILWLCAALIYLIIGFKNQNTPFVVLGFACVTIGASEKKKARDKKIKG